MDVLAAHSEIRFSTDAEAPRGRLAYFREVLGRSICRVDLSFAEERPLKWTARMRLFDDLTVSSGQTSGHLARRGPSLLSDGNEDLLFTTNRSGFSLVSQRGREWRLDAGAAVLGSSAEPGSQDFPGSARWLTLRIPRRRLAGLVGPPEDAVIRPIPASTEALRLLVDYVDTALRQQRMASPLLQRAFSAHVYDLVALAVGATRDAAEFARGRGLRAGRLNAAKGDILRHLEDEGLTVAGVAGRLGVTPRYLQRLFEGEGTTFTEYVAGQRLARAYRLLSNPRFLDRTITTIAFDVGFGNLSHFNRLFRRNYGATPSDVRAHIRGTVPQDH